MNRKILIFRHTPIDVDIRMYEYFACNLWADEVVVYAETSFNHSRVVCGYQQDAKGIRTVIADSTNTVFDDFFFYENRNEIFLFYGIEMAKKYLDSIKKYRLKYGIVSERALGFDERTTIKTAIINAFPVIRYLKNRYLFRNICCFLAMGQDGVRCYSRYFGIRKSVLFDFMYNDGNDALKPIYRHKDDAIRFVYVGRFEYEHKGVDILLKAFQGIDDNCSLDLIGGYGTDAEKIKEKARTMSNVTCMEACDRNELCHMLNQYDVIIVPSRKDGWNLHCNLSINAGLGAIATDQTISDELVRQCGNGIVIPAGDVQALQKEMQKIIENPHIINEWKKKTIDYAKKISYTTVAHYLLKVLKYSFSDSNNTERPVCPWL